VLVSQSSANRIWIPRTTTATVYIWVTVLGRFGQTESQPNPSGNGAPAAALSITTGFRATVDRSSHVRTLVGTGAGNTTNQSTVSTINQSAAPTYAWVRTSGSTKISVIASTSATTGFSATGLVDGEEVQALFTCTATSSGASPTTATVTVTVIFRRDDSFGS
jgi:hypothetical protein